MSTRFSRAAAPAALVAAAVALAFAPDGSRASLPTQAPALPSVTTGPAHAVGAVVTLTGSINPHGLATTYYFEYGPANPHGGAPENYASRAPALPAEPRKVLERTVQEQRSERVTESVPTLNLPPGYHYRLVAKNEKGTRPGRDEVYSPKPTKSTFQLPASFHPIVVGEEFVLSGTLNGSEKANRQLILQGTPYPYTGVPVAEASAITSTTGSFLLRIPHLTTSTKFRVATASGPLTSSESFIQLATVRVTLKAQTSRHVKGLVRLFGTVSPAAVGARVFLQLEQLPKPKPPKAGKLEKENGPRFEEQEKPPAFATKFTTVVKHATKRVSRFSVVVTVKSAGAYRAFVLMPLGSLASGASETVALHAAPKQHKK